MKKKKETKCPKCNSPNIKRGTLKVYAEYCEDCGEILRIIARPVGKKDKDWWKKK